MGFLWSLPKPMHRTIKPMRMNAFWWTYDVLGVVWNCFFSICSPVSCWSCCNNVKGLQPSYQVINFKGFLRISLHFQILVEYFEVCPSDSMYLLTFLTYVYEIIIWAFPDIWKVFQVFLNISNISKVCHVLLCIVCRNANKCSEVSKST